MKITGKWKAFYNGEVVTIEFGKHFEIMITRELAEQFMRMPIRRKKEWKGFARKLKEGDILPSLYGFAYYDLNIDCGVYMPVPINLIVALWRWFIFNVYSYPRLRWPHWIQHKLYAEARAQYDKGYNDCYSDFVQFGKPTRLPTVLSSRPTNRS